MSDVTGSGSSFVVYLPAVGRLWKPRQAESEAIFHSAFNARKAIKTQLSGRGALAGARPMRIIQAANNYAITSPPQEGAIAVNGWWLAEC